MDFSEVLKRRTIRQFTQEPLKKEDLCAILNAARLASCASNKQRLRYLVATESSLVAKILPHTAYAALVQPHRDPVPGRTSPTAFIAVVCNCEPAPLLHADAGAAIQSMEFAAWERGIGCCWIGFAQDFCNTPSFKQDHGVLPGYELVAALSMEYAEEHPKPPERKPAVMFGENKAK